MRRAGKGGTRVMAAGGALSAARQAPARQAPKYELVEAGFRILMEGLGMEQSAHTARTAERAARAWWDELCRGLTQPPPVVTTFPSEDTSMVLLRQIPVRSVCAHHLLPFVGTAVVAYIPGSKQILGLSKLSRLVDYYARQPQVQERLTAQVADAVAAHVLGAGGQKGGVGVFIRANHMCMQLRGVKHDGDMMTSALRGVFRRPEVRAEFLQLAGGGFT
jgi:GTP cyclohydrolase I